MKHLQKLTAALLSGSILLTAMPVSAAWAAGVDEETGTMTATVTLSDSGITVDGENVTVDGSTVTVTASGDYQFSGSLSDGQICVNILDITEETGDPGTVKLYLDGVSMTGKTEAPLYVVNAEKTIIELAADSQNYFYDGETYTATTAAIHAKDDLTIRGEGYLKVTAAYQDGIQCGNDLKINGGEIKVKTELGDGIRGKTSVEIKDGTIDVNAAGDGIKSTKGDLIISGGTADIKAGNDALQGETSLLISGGTIKANGDRGLRLEGNTISITGGTILATATDYQVTTGASLEAIQPVLLFDLTAEQVKDQDIVLERVLAELANEPVFSMTPDKKFDYILISSPQLAVGDTYALTVGGNSVSVNGNTEFKTSDVITAFTEAVVNSPADAISADINLDGTESLEDAVLLAHILAEDPEQSANITAEMYQSADVNKDGCLDMKDLNLVLQHLG